MNIPEILKAIDVFCESHKKFLLKLKLRKHCPRVYKKILGETSFLDKYEVIKNGKSNLSIFERIFCLRNNLTERPLCQKCHKNRVEGFNIQANTYRKWCCPSCQASDDECIGKSKLTRKKIYGQENYNGINKSRETRMLKNNGHWHPDDFQDKVRQTNIKNGHGENWNNSEKRVLTINKKVEENPNYWIEREKKTKQTKIQNGHDGNWNNRQKFKETIDNFSKEKHDSIIQKRKKTNLEKYNVEAPLQVKDFYDKAVNTLQEKYGVSTTFDIPSIREKSITSKKELALEYIHKNNKYTPLFTDSEFIQNRDPSKKWLWKCNTCGTNFFSTYQSGYHNCCPNCERPIGSKQEQIIFEEIQKFYNQEIIHGRGSFKIIQPYQLDFYFPDKCVAIEYNGIYWHKETEDKDSKVKHLKKTKLCESKGIKLLHIFSDELEEKFETTIDVLKQMLLNKEIIAIEKVSFSEIDYQCASQFHNAHNLLGGSKSKHNILLSSDQKPLALMSISKCKFNKKYEFQIDRFSSIATISQDQVFRILTQYIKEKFGNSIVFYQQRRLPLIDPEKTSLKLIKRNKPQFWYTDSYTRIDKIIVTQTFAKNVCQDYDEQKSISENMVSNGFSKIWDCGTDVYEV